MSSEKKAVSVIVLGDFGRSPRMQYHSLSLLRRNFAVDVVAYQGSDPLEEINRNENVHFHYMNDVPQFFGAFPGIVRYVLKTLWQSLILFITCLRISAMDYILLQNPPSIPTLPIACFISWWKNCHLIVDFHNYGYTILGLSAGNGSLLVKIAKWCEKFFSKKADNFLCVTKAMKMDLLENWNVRAHVFYDCAPELFHPISVEEKHSFFVKLRSEYSQFSSLTSNPNEEKTRFTQKVDGEIEMLNKRPALIVSSTSWTEDEDFSILLSALEDYEQAAKVRDCLPHLIVAITGKGPLKSFYEKQIEDKGFTCIEIITMWLKTEDYPTFLACADLGVSLHSSSSGLDLPMKVVDMFGCHLPVCALSFPCLDELVKDGVNGKIFSNSRQLSAHIQKLFADFPENRTDLITFRENLEQSGNLLWEENWDHTVYPLFTKN